MDSSPLNYQESLLLCLHVVFSLHVSISLHIVCSFYQYIRHTGLGVHSIPVWLHLNQWHLQWLYFQIRSHSEGLGLQHMNFREDIIQPLTLYRVLSQSTHLNSLKCSQPRTIKIRRKEKHNWNNLGSFAHYFTILYAIRGDWEGRWVSAVHSVRCNFLLPLGNSAWSHSEYDLVLENMYLIIYDIFPRGWLYYFTFDERLFRILLGCSSSLYRDGRKMLLHFIEFFHFYLDCLLHPSLTSVITKQISQGGKLSAFQWNKEGVKEEKKEGNKKWKTSMQV